MKKYIYSIFAVFALVLCASCSDENEPARTPVATVEVSKTDLGINESMEIVFTGVADQVTVFTGDEGHVYQDFGDGTIKDNTGIVVNKGRFSYSYAVPGTFHVVVIATTYDTYLGENKKTAKHEFDVVVTDNCTTLDKVYSSITPNIYYATQANDRDWVLCLPTKQVYKNKEIAIKLNKQRLSFDIASSASVISVNGEEWLAKNYYDLTQLNEINVKAMSGATRDYRLYTAIYPEFDEITVGGVKGNLSRNAFDQDLMTYTFTGAANTTDVAFTPTENAQLFVNGQPAGEQLDLSSADEYTLVYTNPENTDVKAVSRLVFVFN